MTSQSNGAQQIGPYRLLRQLGVSGLGAVWRAVDTRTDRHVSLKVLLGEHRADPRCRSRFRDESEFALTVHHPGLCRAIERGEGSDGVPYLALELLEGVPLAQIDPGRPWEPQRAVNLVLGLADAVGALHGQGRLHCDLNPSCVLVQPDGRPVLLDHGMSRPIRDVGTLVTVTPAAEGPQAYLAPEQIQGPTEDLGPATDVYALGVILYQLLTGRLPYQGRGAKVFQEILSGNAASPATMRADLEPALNVVCLRAMARQIAHRYPNTERLALALRQAIVKRPEGRPPSEGLIDTDLPTFVHSVQFDSGPDVSPGKPPANQKLTAVTALEGKPAEDDEPQILPLRPPDPGATMGPAKRGMPTLQPRGGPPTHRAPLPLSGALPALPPPESLLPPSRGKEPVPRPRPPTEATLTVQKPIVSLPDTGETGPEVPKTIPPDELLKRVGSGAHVVIAPFGVLPSDVDLSVETRTALSQLPPSPPGVDPTLPPTAPPAVSRMDHTAAPTDQYPVLPGLVAQAQATPEQPLGPRSEPTLASPGSLSVPLWVEPEPLSPAPTAATAPMPVEEPLPGWAMPLVPTPPAQAGPLVSMLPPGPGSQGEFPFNVPTAPAPLPMGAVPPAVEPPLAPPRPGSGSMPVMPFLPSLPPYQAPPPEKTGSPWWLILLAVTLLCVTLFAIVLMVVFVLLPMIGPRPTSDTDTGSGTASVTATTSPTGTIRPAVTVVAPTEPVQVVAGYPTVVPLTLNPNNFSGTVEVTVNNPGGVFRPVPPLIFERGQPRTPLVLELSGGAVPRERQQVSLAVQVNGVSVEGAKFDVDCFSATATLKPVASVRSAHGGPVAGVAFSHNGRYLALGGADRAVQVWDMQRAEVAQTLRWNDHREVVSLAFSPGDDRLAIIGWGGPVVVWQFKDGTWRHERTIDPSDRYQVSALAFNPAGDRLALALPVATEGPDRRKDFKWVIDFWDRKAVKLFQGLDQPTKAPVTAIAWGLNVPPAKSTWVAAAHDSPLGDIRVQDVDDQAGKNVRRFQGHSGPVLSLAASSDGKNLVSGGSDGTVRLWDMALKSGREIGKHSGPVVFVAFSADGKEVASATASGSATVRTQAGAVIKEFAPLAEDQARGWAFRPDGSLLCRTTMSGKVELLRVRPGANLAQPPERAGTVEGVAFSPDGSKMATSGPDHLIRLWELGQGSPRLLRALRGHTEAVGSLAFSPDSKLLASGGSDKTARLWDVDSGREVPTGIGKLPSFCYSVAFSPDGRFLAIGSGIWNGVEYTAGEVRVWDRVQDRPRWTQTAHNRMVRTLAFSPDGRYLASGGGDSVIKVWRADSGVEAVPPLTRCRGNVRSLAFSPDGRWLAAGGLDSTDTRKPGEVHVWAVRGAAVGGPPSEPLAFEAVRSVMHDEGMVRGVAFSSSSRTLITVGNRGAIKLWDVSTLNPHPGPSAQEGHDDDVHCVAVGKDGRVATGSDSIQTGEATARPTLLLWELKEGLTR